MTKIIDPNPSAKIAERVTCPNCGVLLEYVPADTRKVSRTDYTGSSDTYRILDCPKCNHAITVGYL